MRCNLPVANIPKTLSGRSAGCSWGGKYCCVLKQSNRKITWVIDNGALSPRESSTQQYWQQHTTRSCRAHPVLRMGAGVPAVCTAVQVLKGPDRIFFFFLFSAINTTPSCPRPAGLRKPKRPQLKRLVARGLKAAATKDA